MSSQESVHDSPVTVTPGLGKGTLDTWRFHRQRGGRTQSRHQADACGGTRLWANHGGRGVCEPALEPLRRWVGLWKKGQGFKPDRGNPAVRHYRGASENVTLVEMCSHLATERAGMGTLHLTVGASELYPNPFAEPARMEDYTQLPASSPEDCFPPSNQWLFVVCQSVRFYSHVICPVRLFGSQTLFGLPKGVCGF
jgi:hypothetical protein